MCWIHASINNMTCCYQKVADVKLTNRFLWLEQGEAESETNARIQNFILKLKQSCAPVRCLPPSPMEIGPTASLEKVHPSHSWEHDPTELPRSVAKVCDCELLPATIRLAGLWNHLTVAAQVRRFKKHTTWVNSPAAVHSYPLSSSFWSIS